MISKSDITDALDACGIPWAEPTFAPRKTPEPPYAVLVDTYSYDGSDECVGLIGHDTSVYLYDAGGAAGAAKRLELANALASRGVKFKQYRGSYSYDLKLLESEFEVLETYYEKWSD